MLLMACLALLLGQLSGAHLHLCFDGQEPPATLHLIEDEGAHNPHAAMGRAHFDADLGLFSSALEKKSSSALDLLPFLIATVIVLGVARVRSFFAPRIERAAIRVAPALFELHPPLRGPPR